MNAGARYWEERSDWLTEITEHNLQCVEDSMRTCQGTEDVRNGYIEHAELSMTEGTEALRAGGRSDHAEVTTITCELCEQGNVAAA